MDFQIQRTHSKNSDFIDLVAKLDSELKIVDGEDHSFYNQFNGIESLNHCIVIFDNQKPVGCGALKHFKSKSMEIKRMYVLPTSRGKGIATKILKELENWAFELEQSSCVLETGKKQPEAIALYTKSNYRRIPNYGPYIGVENSCCFEKKL